MKAKIYDGYHAYQYLDTNDFRQFDLVDEIERVPSHIYEVSDSQEQRVQHLLEENLVISLHDHPQCYPKDPDEFIDYSREGRGRVAYKGLANSGLDCVFDNIFNGTSIITSKRGWKWSDIIHDIGMRVSDIDHQDFVIVCRRIDDIDYARMTDRVGLVITLESATPIENELERIEILYGLGVRSMGITYSQSNALGDGLHEPRDAGLSHLGRDAVRLMNRIGIAIDVAHCGDQTSLDTIKISKKPVLISHAGARGLWPTSRMKPDEVIKACAQKGGVIGIEAAPHSTLTDAHPQHCLDSFMEHFEYCVDLVGIEHVTFGPDTLFGDHVGLHKAFASHFRPGKRKVGYEEVKYVRGLENPAECFPNIVRWLVKHDYSDEEISKVIGGNTMRVLKDSWYI